MKAWKEVSQIHPDITIVYLKKCCHCGKVEDFPRFLQGKAHIVLSKSALCPECQKSDCKEVEEILEDEE